MISVQASKNKPTETGAETDVTSLVGCFQLHWGPHIINENRLREQNIFEPVDNTKYRG